MTQVEAIIEPELFETVQVKLRHNQEMAKRHNTVHDYLLRALVSCGCCQSRCTGVTRNGVYRYYRCNLKNGAKRFCQGRVCLARYTPARQLEEFVWNDLCKILQNPEIIYQAIERLRDGQWLPQELQARQTKLKHAQRSVQQQLERLTQAYLTEVLQLEEYRRRRVELEHQLQALSAQERQLIAQSQQQLEMMQLVQGAENFCQRV
ncbi:MAG TPA: recombinase zinc beta ribbon domain-containing protein [Allocoleopsis sp.]